MQQDFLRHRVGVGIGDQVLANLRVDVVAPVFVEDGVKANGHSIGQLVGVVGMHQHTHRRRQVINAVEFTLRKGPEVPQAGVHLFERLGNAILLCLFGVLSIGVVKSGPIKAGQILVVRARTVAQRRSFSKPPVHLLQRRDHPVRRRRLLDLLAQLFELVLLDLEVRLKLLVGQHLFYVVIQFVGLHELVVEVERHREPVGDGTGRKIQRA